MYELKQALTNILDNAINYTREGYIRVTIKSKSIQISDSGIGISKDDLKKIFNQYYRSENAKELKPNGSGIGLYISKKIFERSKLKLIVTSELGVGTTFIISQQNPRNSQEK
jgi:signal transduction histidine kinase